MTEASPWKRRAALTVRICIALAVVAWLLQHLGPERILYALRSADPLYLAGAFVALLVQSLAKLYNWAQLLRSLGMARRRVFRRLAYCYFSGAMFGTLVPSTAGTDAIRAVMARHEFGGEMSGYVASVVVMNVLGWMASCTLGLAAVLMLAMSGPVPQIAYLGAPIFAGVTAGALTGYALLKYRRNWWLWMLRRLPRKLFRFRRPVRRFSDHLLVFERAHVRFMPIFATALFAQFCLACTIALNGAAVGIELPFQYWLIYGPLVAMAGLIPGSISGFGSDQAAYVLLMAMVGVAEALAFVASALFAIENFVVNIVVGGTTFILKPSSIRNPQSRVLPPRS